MTKPSEFRESALNLISEGARIEGKLELNQIARIHGSLVGELVGTPQSELTIAETGSVEGNIRAHTLYIDGYVKGDIQATQLVFISRTGRVVGNIETPSLKMEFGSYFEGRCLMPEAVPQ